MQPLYYFSAFFFFISPTFSLFSSTPSSCICLYSCSFLTDEQEKKNYCILFFFLFFIFKILTEYFCKSIWYANRCRLDGIFFFFYCIYAFVYVVYVCIAGIYVHEGIDDSCHGKQKIIQREFDESWSLMK